MFLHYLLLLLLFAVIGEGANRNYYIAIEEIGWNYAPSGLNLMTNISLDLIEDAAVFTTSGTDRIGRKYKKVAYREYEDATFSTRSARAESLGILGPVLRAEVGDTVIIHARNLASRNYSFHPHGIFYEKDHEGALYKDGTTGSDKEDDSLAPGASYVYEWVANPEYGPSEDEPNCLTWVYHSHVNAAKDTNSGLIGPLLVCRPGSLDGNGYRLDVDNEYILLFTVFDENESWYLDYNIQEYCGDPGSVDTGDEDFQESNKMHGINGLMYGNLEGISACEGNTVSWHLFGMGTEVDIHSAYFQGQTVIISGHRQDTVSVFPAIFTVAMMEANNVGSWDITCMVNDHLTAGMTTKFNVETCGAAESDASSTSTREYFIEISEVEWNYGPSGLDLKANESLTSNGTDSKTFFEQGENRIGGTYSKAVFRGYESVNFSKSTTRHQYDGILGPLIAAEVGDSVRVTLRNSALVQPYNIEPHGVNFETIEAVSPGKQNTYVWYVPETAAPTDLDGDCITYLYTSSVDPVKDTNSGLVGPLVVCKRGTLDNYLSRPSYYLLFTVFDENQSHYLDANIANFTSNSTSVDKGDADFMESNLMHSINGLMYGNLLGIDLCVNEDTDFHVIGLGTEVDMHSMLMSEQNIEVRKENSGVISVFPHTTASATVRPSQVTSGEIFCRTNDHLVGGMTTSYKVAGCGSEQTTEASSGRVRTYYIGAVDEVWDYLPSKQDIFGNPIDSESTLWPFVHQEDGKYIGQKYTKAIFYEYTDISFTQRKNKSIDLGMLGPVISAEGGDQVTIFFKNMARRTYSLTTWGNVDEQSPSSGVVSAESGGDVVTYNWKIPSSAAPRSNQPECNAYMYMSNVDAVKDIYTGLVGPLLICRQGTLSDDGHSAVSDQDFYLLFLVVNENESHYLDDNIREFAKVEPETMDKTDGDFVESNLMHSINGRLTIVEGLVMYEGDRVLWHLMGLGTEVDIHTIHFHAHAYKHITDVEAHEDVFTLFPGKIGTVDMEVSAVGTWLLHCHVNDHINAGMETTYTVVEKTTEESGLSDGAIVGIVIGCVVVAALIIGITCLIFKSNKGKVA